VARSQPRSPLTAPLRAKPRSPLRRRIALSQNFIKDPRLVDALLDGSSIGPCDVVYEIGPGEGTITERLARRCRHVVAVEKDPHLADRLRRRFSGDRRTGSVTVFLDDFLTFPLPVTPYKVFANVPFAITAGIVSRLAAAPNPPEDAYLAVQREAASRYVDGTLVSILLRPHFEPTILHRFSRHDFFPEPGVDVVLFRLRKRGPPLLSPAELQPFRDFVVHGFTAWQPTLRAAYRVLLDRRAEACLRERTGYDLSVLPSALPFDAWLTLFRCFREIASPRAHAALDGAERRLRAQQSQIQKDHRTRFTERAYNARPKVAGR
jgi:23S rRNA (adenine-N6)-dimethyltransferase